MRVHVADEGNSSIVTYRVARRASRQRHVVVFNRNQSVEIQRSML